MTSPLWINAGHGSSLGTATIATDGTFTLVAHGLADNQAVMVDTFTGGAGAVLRDDAIYYVTAVATDTFQLVSATGDEVIEFGSTGGADVYTAVPSYDALSLRRSMTALTYKGVSDALGARAGVDPFGGEASPVVTVSGSTVEVHDRTLVLYPGLSSADGAYLCHLTDDTHTLDPADGTNPRIDIVVARVYDDDHDASGRRECVTEYIAGSPAADPDPPNTPAGALLLTEITVPQSGGGSATAEYVAPWTVANGGVLPVRDGSEYPSAGIYSGMVLWDRILNALIVRAGGSWVPVAQPTGWEVLHDTTIVSATTFDLTERAPAGTYSRVRVSLVGSLDANGRIGMQVNADGTTDLHASAWTAWNLDDGGVEDSNSTDAEVWPIAMWANHDSCNAEATIYRTDANAALSYAGSGCQEAAGTAFRRVTHSTGHLTADRLIDSLRVTSVAGAGNLVQVRVTIEGFRP